MNQVNLVGRVAREPKFKTSSNGKSMIFLTVAIDGYYDRKTKEVTTDFIPVTVWGKEAERCRSLIKGSLVRITGRVSVGKFPDKETGEIKYVTDIIGEEVQFLAKPKGASSNE